MNEQQAPDVTLSCSPPRRLREGHGWIFSNELAHAGGELPGVGALVAVRDQAGELVASGLFHPHSLIAVRVLASRRLVALDAAFFSERLERARDLRERLFPGQTCYRLCYGESDGLPGLLIDRYGEHFVLQTTCAGMDQRLDAIAEVLERLFAPASIIESNDSPLRELEGLPPRHRALLGAPPDEITVRLDDVEHIVQLAQSQKTGLFLDQRRNYRLLAAHAQGRRVLDGFCYQGGFALAAAVAGAASVVGIDSSQPALERAAKSAVRNGVADRCRFRKADLFRALAELRRSEERFDLIILDPPSFTRSKRHVPEAKRAYRELNTNALRFLRPGGILATASCSHHIHPDTFHEMLLASAASAGRNVRVLAWEGQSPDHPVLLGMPETQYLKFALLEVVAF
ncbi:MAG: class I SAM-dependent rRNA methyltransferase [Candidatus Schekmanbacteria bacterium]|nr:class I SAM-dependent rRNA methyltransferase [Candidatus Schekmanbacteria bacterium]